MLVGDAAIGPSLRIEPTANGSATVSDCQLDVQRIWLNPEKTGDGASARP